MLNTPQPRFESRRHRPQASLARLQEASPARCADLFVDVAEAYIEESCFNEAVGWLRLAIENPEVRERAARAPFARPAY